MDAPLNCFFFPPLNKKISIAEKKILNVHLKFSFELFYLKEFNRNSFFLNGIGATIHIGQEIQWLPYAEFLLVRIKQKKFIYILPLTIYHLPHTTYHLTLTT